MSGSHRCCIVRPVGLERRPSEPHLVLSGEVDLAVAPSLRQVGLEAAKEAAKKAVPGRLVVDVGEVTFMDSSGLGALISLRNATRECGISLVLVGVSPAVNRFFDLAGVRDSFDFE